jgi:hypothetical protein
MRSHAERYGLGEAAARRGFAEADARRATSDPAAPVPDMSPSDAAARLRYVAGIRERTRAAVLLPAFVALVLGGIGSCTER